MLRRDAYVVRAVRLASATRRDLLLEMLALRHPPRQDPSREVVDHRVQ
jgi:hypothetical protein